MVLLNALLSLIRESKSRSEREAFAHIAMGALAASRDAGVLSDDEARRWAGRFLPLVGAGEVAIAVSKLREIAAASHDEHEECVIDTARAEDALDLKRSALVSSGDPATFRPVSVEIYADRVVVRWTCPPEAWRTFTSSATSRSPFELVDQSGTPYRHEASGGHALRDGPVFGASSYTPGVPDAQRSLTLKSPETTWAVTLEQGAGERR